MTADTSAVHNSAKQLAAVQQNATAVPRRTPYVSAKQSPLLLLDAAAAGQYATLLKLSRSGGSTCQTIINPHIVYKMCTACACGSGSRSQLTQFLLQHRCAIGIGADLRTSIASFLTMSCSRHLLVELQSHHHQQQRVTARA